MTALDYRPPRRDDFQDYTSYDGAWKQWVADEMIRTRNMAIERMAHLDRCIDELKEAVAMLVKRMRGEEIDEAEARGAAEVKKRQAAFFKGIASGLESWFGKAALFGLGAGAVTFLTKVVGL
jgi:hypothetical protein